MEDIMTNTLPANGTRIIVSRGNNRPFWATIKGEPYKHGGKGFEDLEILKYNGDNWLATKSSEFFPNINQKYCYQVMRESVDGDYDDLRLYEDDWFFDIDEAMNYCERSEDLFVQVIKIK
jgi:hypothetical protein